MRKTNTSIFAVVLAFVMLLNIFSFVGPLYAESASMDKLLQNEKLIGVTDNSYTFKDISAHWAKEGVLKLSYMEILKGFPDGTMRPDKTLTREEFITMLVRAIDLPMADTYAQSYKDVDLNRWSSKYIGAAKSAGLLDIYNQAMMYPAKIITREEMAVIAAKVAKGVPVSIPSTSFTDLSASYKYLDSINIVTALDIIRGMPDGSFKPYSGATRAQAAVIIQRILDLKVSDNEEDNNSLIAFAENYEKSNMSSPNLGTLSTQDILGYSIGKERKQNIQRNTIINSLNFQGMNLDRSITDFIAFVSYKSKYLADATVSYKLSTATDDGALREYRITNKLNMKKSSGQWVVYNSDAVYSILNEVAVEKSEKINMTWQNFYKLTPDMSGKTKIDGLDIVSPTWFTLSNANGDFNNIASKDYTDWAHQNGYKVWALVDNNFNRELTSQMLNNPAARANAIDNLIRYAKDYNLDGLNIDFEYMYTREKNLYTQFIRELYQKAKPLGITLSLDVTIIVSNSDWSSSYDRKALSQVSDYMILMAYDQHWVGGPTSGSVSQLKWVDENLQKVLLEIPKEKLLLGMPFYTIVWKEAYDANGKLVVTSNAVSMQAAEKLVSENNAVKKWDAASGQYFATYNKDGAVYKIWLEDETSIRLRVDLANQYELAGVASWKMGLEKPEIWNIIQTTMK